jgi:pyrrolidone-carboxylate peptidase
LCCTETIYDFDKSTVALLRRMLNLEELDLNLKVDGKIIDDDTLKKDIIIYMPRLYKLTINIRSTIYHHNQTNFPFNEHIQKTSKYFCNNQMVTCIDHFQEKDIVYVIFIHIHINGKFTML